MLLAGNLVCVVQLVGVRTLAGTLGVAAADDDAISLTMLSHLGAVDPSALGGYRSHCSGRGLQLLQ